MRAGTVRGDFLPTLTVRQKSYLGSLAVFAV